MRALTKPREYSRGPRTDRRNGRRNVYGAGGGVDGAGVTGAVGTGVLGGVGLGVARAVRRGVAVGFAVGFGVAFAVAAAVDVGVGLGDGLGDGEGLGNGDPLRVGTTAMKLGADVAPRTPLSFVGRKISSATSTSSATSRTADSASSNL